jgi:hypothetical protein
MALRLCPGILRCVQIAFALLADYTMTSKEDKFSVMGIYDRIGAQSFPARHRQLQLAIRIVGSPADFGQDFNIKVELVDGEGKAMTHADGVISVPMDLERAPNMNLVMQFEDVVFPHSGDYQFNVFLDGKVVAEVPLGLEEIPT